MPSIAVWSVLPTGSGRLRFVSRFPANDDAAALCEYDFAAFDLEYLLDNYCRRPENRIAVVFRQTVDVSKIDGATEVLTRECR